MSREATIVASLTVINGNLNYRTAKESFQADVPTAAAPGPGRVKATTGGVDVDLTGLSSPGLAMMENLDSTNYVTYGKWDGTTFHPLGELLPGEQFPLRLARNILSGSEKLRLVANTATCECLVDVFERA